MKPAIQLCLGRAPALLFPLILIFICNRSPAASPNEIPEGGSHWSALAGGVTSTFVDVYSMTVHNGELVIGGQFGAVDGVPANGVARWNGLQWQSYGPGVSHATTSPIVWTVLSAGGQLYIGGRFTAVNGVPAQNIARWNGSSWQAVGTGLPNVNYVRSLAAFNGGIIAGTTYDAFRWTGNAWQQLGGGVNGNVNSMTVFNGELIVSGGFNRVGGLVEEGGILVSNIARWNGSAWSPLGAGLNGPVSAVHTNGSLVAGGEFSLSDGGRNIAMWNGTAWVTLGGSLGGPGLTFCNCVRALASYAGQVVAAGDFTTAGSQPMAQIAVLNGTRWGPMDSGISGTVHALMPFGSVLIAAGRFSQAGGVNTRNIAQWNYPNATLIFTHGFE